MKLKLDEINDLVAKYNKKAQFPVSDLRFMEHARRYIKAINERRMICNITSVSRSGMSRNMKFVEVSKGRYKEHNLLNFYEFFLLLGYSKVGNSGCFRIGGCGMDMVFATNYNIIHRLQRLGFMTKKQCAVLAQKTPHVI